MTANITGYSGQYDGLEHDEFSTFQILNEEGDDITSNVTVSFQVGDATYSSINKVKNVADSKTINYTISYSGYNNITGTVEVKISPAKLTITTPSAEKSYDGTPLIAEPAIVNGLVAGETIEVICTGTQTAVGLSSNNYSIVDWQTAKADNYEIIENLGTLTVKSALPSMP